ncbi:hypothetical protein JD969_00580 [Planctomycetota bacterium]|nr:hypothetical protein JD969_00580 [Planctomycetota bacterium]
MDDDQQSMETSMSIMGSGESEPAIADDSLMLDDPKENKLASSGAIIFIIVIIIAAGALYGMHLMNNNLSMADSTQAIEAKIETYLTKLNNPKLMDKNDPLRRENMDLLFNDTPEIVGVLQANVSGQQIPIEYVKKDPFAMAVSKRPVQNINLRFEQQKRLKRIDQLSGEMKRLNLQSVMGGRVPVAIVDGEFYRKGDQIGNFTIVKINNKKQTVELLAEGQTFVLMMD